MPPRGGVNGDEYLRCRQTNCFFFLYAGVWRSVQFSIGVWLSVQFSPIYIFAARPRVTIATKAIFIFTIIRYQECNVKSVTSYPIDPLGDRWFRSSHHSPYSNHGFVFVFFRIMDPIMDPIMANGGTWSPIHDWIPLFEVVCSKAQTSVGIRPELSSELIHSSPLDISLDSSGCHSTDGLRGSGNCRVRVRERHIAECHTREYVSSA